ncbi:11268_t:CDS:2 [Acaulospora morrowiae]|uniref:11268_t:CDS:1 n=1 Tax=Acaulospora morrowiae TaxID=94023 RepID=A0A9N9FKZ5_9GLOM|nr:11268_t:CDS:2 [Acaulospora morrowiae]
MSSNSTIPDGLSKSEKLLIAHAVFAALACLVTMPFGIYIARFGRKTFQRMWFHLHWSLQFFFSTIFIAVGFTLAHVVDKTHNNWANKPHSAIPRHEINVIYLGSIGRNIIVALSGGCGFTSEVRTNTDITAKYKSALML